jgi:hypothetical protein
LRLPNVEFEIRLSLSGCSRKHAPAGGNGGCWPCPPRGPRRTTWEWITLVPTSGWRGAVGELNAAGAGRGRLAGYWIGGRLPSALRCTALAWAPVMVKLTGDGLVSEQYSPLPSLRPPHYERTGTSVLLLRVNPQAVLSMAKQPVTLCAAPAPPSLKPLPSPLEVPPPDARMPFRNAHEFSITTTLGAW